MARRRARPTTDEYFGAREVGMRSFPFRLIDPNIFVSRARLNKHVFIKINMPANCARARSQRSGRTGGRVRAIIVHIIKPFGWLAAATISALGQRGHIYARLPHISQYTTLYDF